MDPPVIGSDKRCVLRQAQSTRHVGNPILDQFPPCLQAVYKSNTYLLIWNPVKLKFLLKGL